MKAGLTLFAVLAVVLVAGLVFSTAQTQSREAWEYAYFSEVIRTEAVAPGVEGVFLYQWVGPDKTISWEPLNRQRDIREGNSRKFAQEMGLSGAGERRISTWKVFDFVGKQGWEFSFVSQKNRRSDYWFKRPKQ